ncbi:baseplate J/gp47 family protein [Sphingomonas sp. SORGH_AS_0438]|uniref:baseplate assembly protein n=1 Tax=Sphingomonas sp. SORGH_AS_0438 TaxID=3041756 RepID=UPI00286798BA|nr:baseplate J/gp47 family protein [Sphingomonas sp. SORGH_AS_0438]MDR6128047.1 phage-related baseplate assembly protein [Sphingomonas sp. SORGH_AS_0438]
MASYSAAFTPIDLSRLPAPEVLETLSFEAIYADLLASLQAMVPDFDATIESDPAVKLLQLVAYREMLLRARINDAARAVMPAFAVGADLDQLAALLGVARLTRDPGDPTRGVPAVMETDDEFRRRLVLAPEGYSVAGPEGAYIFHALSADPAVLDASATSPTPGRVVVTILSRVNDGTASAALVATVMAYLSADTRRPMTDALTVQPATIIRYAIDATIRTFDGPDASIVLKTARARLDDYVAACHRLGRDVARSGILAALHVEGVVSVQLAAPAADIPVDRTQAPWCTGIAITHAGIGE